MFSGYPTITSASRRRGRPSKMMAAVIAVMLFAGSNGWCAEIKYDAGGRPDPMVPLIGPGGQIKKGFNASGLNIEGIIFDPGAGSLVLINGEFYRQGDSVNGANVISIFRDRVVMAQDDEEKVIWIREEVVTDNLVKTAEANSSETQESKK